MGLELLGQEIANLKQSPVDGYDLQRSIHLVGPNNRQLRRQKLCELRKKFLLQKIKQEARWRKTSKTK
jgi:hypothetical protein